MLFLSLVMGDLCEAKSGSFSILPVVLREEIAALGKYFVKRKPYFEKDSTPTGNKNACHFYYIWSQKIVKWHFDGSR